MKKIKIVKYSVGKKPYIKKIDDTPEAMQKEVGGYIEEVKLSSDGFVIICNEEGKILNLSKNELGIYGDFFVTFKSGDRYQSVPGGFIKFLMDGAKLS